MSVLTTFRLWLQPDDVFPFFKRLAWEKVGVSIQDVLMHGVHPWMGPESHYSLVDAITDKLNDEDTKIAALDEFFYCSNLVVGRMHFRNGSSGFEDQLQRIRNMVYFVEDLNYLQLMEMAKRRLTDIWSHAIARSLTERTHSSFQELRRFLKGKDSNLRLSGYGDIDRYDLGEVLSLDDFTGCDSVVISEAFPSLNFRRESFLEKITGDDGRLRFVPEIRT